MQAAAVFILWPLALHWGPACTLLLCFSLITSRLALSASSRARFRRTSRVLWLAEACLCARLSVSSSCERSDSNALASTLGAAGPGS